MTIDNANHLRDASPWTGETNPLRRAILGKLAEEMGELQAAVARCLIQGVDEKHPVSGKPNLEWLLEELADVQNMVDFVRAHWYESMEGFEQRRLKKRAHIRQWLGVFGWPQ